MIWPVNIRGFKGVDPLDHLTSTVRFALTSGVTAVVTVGLVLLITRVWGIIVFQGPAAEIAEVALFALVFTPIVVSLRKSSSLVHFAIVLLPLYLLDMYLQTHVRDAGRDALWMYNTANDTAVGDFLESLSPLALRYLVTIGFDAVVIGPVCLWLARLLALPLAGRARTADPREPLPFPEAWTKEEVPRPKRDFHFWVMIGIGGLYFGYLTILLIGGFGSSAWPEFLKRLFDLTYANGVLATHTVAKITILGSIAFIGAYNRRIRFTSALVLAVAHAVSVGALLVLYLVKGEPQDMLLTSTAVDGVFVLLLIVVLFGSRGERFRGDAARALPGVFSLPSAIWRYTAGGFGVAATVAAVGLLIIRFTGWGAAAWGAAFSYPDPGIGNALTLYATLAMLGFMMARSQKTRDHFTSPLQVALLAGIVVGVLIMALTSVTVNIPQPDGAVVSHGARMALAITLAIFGILVAAVTTVRRLYYTSEYSITSFTPSAAQAILGLHEAAFGTDQGTGTLQHLDRYAGQIRGRRRGLLDFPFWLVERVFPLFALRPALSSMSPEERSHYLRRFLIRPENERNRALSPEMAQTGYLLALASHSLVLFGAYAGVQQRQVIKYVPPGGRDRLQGSTQPVPPPFQAEAPLPTGPSDAANWARTSPPGDAAPPPWTPAPRVTAQVSVADIPAEVDYAIIGSGPGGAVAAYRLAQQVDDPGRVIVVERGARYTPSLDFNEDELEMIAKLYKEGGVQQTKRADMGILQGECVGGTSVSNNAVCFRMPNSVTRLWREEFDLDLPGLPAEYDRVAEEINIHALPTSGINKNVREAFEQAVRKENLGSPDRVEVNAPGAIGDGVWNLGNLYQGKRTMLETYLPWAEAKGVRIIPETTAVNFAASGDRVESVLVRTVTGGLRSIRVKKGLIVAGGVIASSHFLMRSNVPGSVGARMSCNFAFPVAFEMDSVVNAFDGEQITLSAIDPENGAIYETYFNPPGAFALTVPFFFGRHRQIMKRYDHLINFGALVGSEANGTLGRRYSLLAGRAFKWRLGETDQVKIRGALGKLLRLGKAAGAVRAIVPTQPGVSFELADENIRAFDGVLAKRSLRLRDLLMNTAHPQGGNVMGGERFAHRVVKEDFSVVGYENLFVVDASLFPSSLTVNPQWTIMAMSSLASASILEKTG